jgi:hypothetical protein
VDNLHADCSEDSLSQFVTALGVNVVSCFGSKSWVKTEDESTCTVKAFRLCIQADHQDKLLSPDLWPTRLIIRPWQFKASKNGDDH